MTLRARLVLGLLAIAAVLVVPLTIAVQSLDRLHREARALREGEFKASLLLGSLREGLNDLRRVEMALLYVHDVNARDAMKRQVTAVRMLADSLDHYNLFKSAGDVRATISEIETWAPIEYGAALAGRVDEADRISAQHIVPAIGRADRGLLDAEHLLRDRTSIRLTRMSRAIAQAKNSSTVAAVLALLLAGTIAFLLTRSVTGPVRELERGMRAVADGDFDHKLRVSPTRRDEFGRLSASFEEMTQQLAALDKLKAEFISIASHELKTPINVVLGYLQLLNEGIYGPVSSQQRDVHRTLEAQVKSLARLVAHLLDVSRFEAGGGRLEVRRTSLPHFLDELERGFRVLAIQRDIRLVSRRGDGLPEEVEWDVDRMSEVLGNLLSNAFKFTERGGEVELGAQATEDWVELEVRDTGAGIPAEQLPHIFEKFYQADNQRGANAKGSGLGLAIAKSIVEAHGGSIRCESTPGVGTTFTVVMPVEAKSRRVAQVLAVAAGAA